MDCEGFVTPDMSAVWLRKTKTTEWYKNTFFEQQTLNQCCQHTSAQEEKDLIIALGSYS